MQISEERLEEMMERAADKALAKIGLDYEGAADDMREVKSFAGIIRSAKKEASRKIVSGLVNLAIAAFVIGLLWLAGVRIPGGK